MCLGKHVSDTFPIKKSLNEGDALLALQFTFSVEYATRKIREIWERLELNVAHQLVVQSDDVNLLDKNVKERGIINS